MKLPIDYPAELPGLAIGDMLTEAAFLWAVTKKKAPSLIIELGTRAAISTHIISLAAPQAEIITVDPMDCFIFTKDIPKCKFIQMTGEEFFDIYSDKVPFIFIDTDPHSYDQTVGWLNTWCSSRLEDEGYAVWHDVRTTPVGPAIKDWIQDKPNYKYEELGGVNGIGVLIKYGG